MNWRLLFTLLAFVICLPLPAPPYPKTRFCGGIVHHFGRHLNYRVERRLPFNDVETELATPYKWGPHRETIYDLERVIDGTRITLSGEPIRAHPFPTYSLVCRRNDTHQQNLFSGRLSRRRYRAGSWRPSSIPRQSY